MSQPPAGKEFTVAEESLNIATHAAGFVLAVAGLALLLARASGGPARMAAGGAVFGAALALVYAASTLYHALPGPRAKRFFNHLDRSAIFLLIAATYTPFALLNPGDDRGRLQFGLVWLLALSGVLFQLLFSERWPRLATPLYLLISWLAVAGVLSLWRMVPVASLRLLLAGCLVYSLGVPFYLWRRLPQHHAIFHLCALAGGACHYLAVLEAITHGSRSSGQ